MSRPTHIILGILLLIVAVFVTLHAGPGRYTTNYTGAVIFALLGIACFLTLPSKSSQRDGNSEFRRKNKWGIISLIISIQAFVLSLMSKVVMDAYAGDKTYEDAYIIFAFVELGLCLFGLWLGVKNQIIKDNKRLITTSWLGLIINALFAMVHGWTVIGQHVFSFPHGGTIYFVGMFLLLHFSTKIKKKGGV